MIYWTCPEKINLGVLQVKKILALACLLLTLVFLVSCGSTKTNNPPKPGNTGNSGITGNAQVLKIQDYFPLKENVHYTYQGEGNEYAAYSVYVDYISEGKVQQRVNNGGTELAKVLEIKDGKLSKIFSRGEAYYRENLLNAQSTDTEVLLKEPLAKGTTWTLKDSRVRKIASISAQVTTPAGSYRAIEVVTEGPNDKTTDFYAKDVGLVKSVFSSEGTEVSSSLSKIEENVPFVQKISFFYPNVNDNKLFEATKEISFKTNDITKQKLELAYKEPAPVNTSKVFSPNTKINSLYLNQDNVVYLDLNSAFLTEMNAGSGYESMILQSLANTFGKYYGSDKVNLTIDNELYESGHILLKKGEYLQVK